MKNLIKVIISVISAVVCGALAVIILNSSYKIDNMSDVHSIVSGMGGIKIALIAVGLFALAAIIPMIIIKILNGGKLVVVTLVSVLIVNGFIAFTWINAQENALTGGFGKKIGFGAIIGTVIGLVIFYFIKSKLTRNKPAQEPAAQEPPIKEPPTQEPPAQA